jgi:hypothetical protein
LPPNPSRFVHVSDPAEGWPWTHAQIEPQPHEEASLDSRFFVLTIRLESRVSACKKPHISFPTNGEWREVLENRVGNFGCYNRGWNIIRLRCATIATGRGCGSGCTAAAAL